MGDAYPGRFNYNRYGVAVEGADDDLFYDVVDLSFIVDDLLKPGSHGADNAVSEEDSEEGPDQRAPDQSTENGGRLVDRAHCLYHPQYAGNNTQGG